MKFFVIGGSHKLKNYNFYGVGGWVINNKCKAAKVLAACLSNGQDQDLLRKCYL